MQEKTAYLFEVALCTETLESKVSSRLRETVLSFRNGHLAADVLAF